MIRKIKIAFQITSRNDFKKIKDTTNGFVKERMYDAYDQLIILIIGKMKRYKRKIIDNEKFTFNLKEHVWDINKLMNDIQGKSLDEVENIHSFLCDELPLPENVQGKLMCNIFEERNFLCIEDIGIIWEKINSLFTNNDRIQKMLNSIAEGNLEAFYFSEGRNRVFFKNSALHDACKKFKTDFFNSQERLVEGMKSIQAKTKSEILVKSEKEFQFHDEMLFKDYEHTIEPRINIKKALQITRDDFQKWLAEEIEA